MTWKTKHLRRWIWYAGTLLATFSIAFAQSAAAPETVMGAGAASNGNCLRCHGMGTLAYRDPDTGAVVSLAVDRAKFSHSNHGKLACVACHKAGLDRFPHPAEAKQERLYCTNCHKDEAKFAADRFPQVEAEFQRSIHRQNMGGRFTCFACHDPHSFDVQRDAASVDDVIAYDNAICLRCHASERDLAAMSNRHLRPLTVSHAWLPNEALHRRHVRCVECHTPHNQTNSHEILPASRSERECVACHTQNSILLTKLYRHRSREERQLAGFVNGVVFNDAYIIGTTRNLLLDRLSVALFGLLLVGLAGHGYGRWKAKRKRPR